MTATFTFDRLPNDHATYTVADGQAAVELATRAGTVALDIETMGKEGRDRLEVKAVAFGSTDTAVVLDPDDDRAAIRDAIDKAQRVVLYNAPFDVPALVAAGLMSLDHVDKVHDLAVDMRLADSNERANRSLGGSCERYLGEQYGGVKDTLKSGHRALYGGTLSDTFSHLDLHSPAYASYAGFDVVLTARLYEVAEDVVEAALTAHNLPTPPQVMRLREREQIVMRTTLRRSARGIGIDLDQTDSVRSELRGQITAANKVLADAGFDISATDAQVKRAVVDALHGDGLVSRTWPRLDDGKPALQVDWIKRVSDPRAEALVDRDIASRALTKYVDGLLTISPDDLIRPQVKILAARTGRMSVSDPALQQYPGALRRMLTVGERITSLDWSSIEPVFLANAAGEAALIEQFEAGGDLYQPVADAAGVERAQAKTVLLAAMYGQGIPSLAMRLGVSEDEARRINKDVFVRMPKASALMEKIRGFGDTAGFVPTMSGRIAALDRDYKDPSRFKGYTGVNYYVQGSCYDLLAESILAMHNAGLADALVMPVHDELVVLTEAADEVAAIMSTPPEVLIEHVKRTPVLRVGRSDLGMYWTEGKK